MSELKRSPLKRTEFKPSEPKPVRGKKKRKCKICRTEFEPISAWAKACSTDCAEQVARQIAAEQKAKEAREERAKDKIKRDAFKKLSDYKAEAQKAWNSYVRARDYGLPCASCGAMPGEIFGGAMDCSHYRSRGAAPHLSFHLHNAASACVRCNRYLGGNVAALRVGLIEKFGLEKVVAVEANNEIRKFSKEYLIRIKKIFTKKAKRKMDAHKRNAS